MKRKLLIEEEFGLWTISNRSQHLGSGASLESALLKAGVETNVGEVNVRNLFEATQVLDHLMGDRAGDGQIHTGVVSG